MKLSANRVMHALPLLFGGAFLGVALFGAGAAVLGLSYPFAVEVGAAVVGLIATSKLTA
jgi:hypothetical protein